MTCKEYDIQNELKEWLKGAQRVVIAGIGNPIRMDDFLGIKIIRELAGKVSNKVFLVECETVPESFTQQIINFRPTHVLLADAAILGLKPGSSRLFKPEQLIDSAPLSTHLLPMKIFCDHIRQMTKAEIAFVLMQPEKTELGEGLTSLIADSVQVISNVLLQVLP